MAELDDLSVHPARLLSDVLPLPAGDVALSAYGLRAASGSWHRVRRAARRDAQCPSNCGLARKRGGAMTAILHGSQTTTAPRPLGAVIMSTVIVITPIVLALICVAA